MASGRPGPGILRFPPASAYAGCPFLSREGDFSVDSCSLTIMGSATEHILFLTGRLAEKSLARTLRSISRQDGTAFTYEIRNVGVSVAGLMTAEMIERRLPDAGKADRVIVPGLCGGDVEGLARHLGVPVQRGPADLRDLPEFFGRTKPPSRLDRYRLCIFAEIVEAPELTVPAILRRAEDYRRDGADVIDLGCLPGRDFPHLEESVRALHAHGFRVSVDSLDRDELLRGGRAGADYLLSLKESTLDLAEGIASTPVIVPENPGDLESLCRAVRRLSARGRRCIADSILDPIHFGFTASLARYRELRERLPKAELMMGVGNLTELTEADTLGINALLLGICSELDIGHILTTQVSPHARSAVYEADRARRIMDVAKREHGLPKGIAPAMLSLHARKPAWHTVAEVEELAERIRDPSYRVLLSEEGIHAFNRDGLISGRDPFDLFPQLQRLQDDAPHAFYMGVELARAQIAWQLGKAYEQDEALEWQAACPPSRRLTGSEPDREERDGEEATPAEARHGAAKPARKAEGSTLQAARRRKARRRESQP